MARLKYWFGRLRAVWSPQHVHDDIAEEMALHIELRTEENIRRGMPPDQARQEARRRFGHLTQIREQGYEQRGGGWVESILHDLAYGLRHLYRAPGFTLAAVLSLALGIGANTAIFSLMDAALLKMLPVKSPEELFFMALRSVPKGKQTSFLPYRFYRQLPGRQNLFSGVCSSIPNLDVSVGNQPEIAHVELVSGNYFSLLGVRPLKGRTFTEDDNKTPGGHPLAILSYSYWQRRFSGDSSIIGKPIILNGHSFTVIGVTSPDFFGVTVGSSNDVWVPSMMRAQIQPGWPLWEQDADEPAPMLLGRLAPGVSESQAQAILNGLWQQFLKAKINASSQEERTMLDRQQGIELTPASRGLSQLRSQFSRPLHVLMAVVTLVLLISCANVANLLLARSAARRKEIAVRLSLGARRSRLIRQLLTESLLIASAAGVLALVLAFWGSHFLVALVSSGHSPVFLPLAIDGHILAFTASISLFAAFLFGIAPALRSTRLELVQALNHTATIASGSPRQGLSRVLVVAQVAVSLLLLISAGLFLRTLRNLRSMDLGFNPENVLVFSTNPQLIGYQGREIPQLYQQMLDRISVIPGVRSASLSRNGLLSGRATYTSVFVLGPHLHAQDDNPAPKEMLDRMYQNPNFFSEVGPRFFETSGIGILRGRGIEPQDTEHAPKVAVVNKAFADYYFGNTDPIGRHFLGGLIGGEIEIVGVVRDEKYRSLREDAPRTFYVPYLQDPTSWRDTTFQVRTAGNPSDMFSAIEHAVHELNKSLPFYNVKNLDKQIDENLVQERLISTLSGFFALLSLLLAAIGLYGITAYGVNQRTQEIGTRMALGAKPTDVLRMVLAQGMWLVIAGIILGLSLSFAATRVVASQLYGVTAVDPFTFGVAPLVLLAVALVACLGPSRRATKVDPLVALRYE